jgi:hypothetical protein
LAPKRGSPPKGVYLLLSVFEKLIQRYKTQTKKYINNERKKKEIMREEREKKKL